MQSVSYPTFWVKVGRVSCQLYPHVSFHIDIKIEVGIWIVSYFPGLFPSTRGGGDHDIGACWALPAQGAWPALQHSLSQSEDNDTGTNVLKFFLSSNKKNI